MKGCVESLVSLLLSHIDTIPVFFSNRFFIKGLVSSD